LVEYRRTLEGERHESVYVKKRKRGGGDEPSVPTANGTNAS